MPTDICLVRHGVTEWNYEGRAQGRSDIPLNHEGIRQAEATAARLGSEPWNAIYSSPSVRALRTAQAIAHRAGLTVQTDDRLMERSLGLAEGTSYRERQQRWPTGDWRVLAGCEEDADLSARVVMALTEIANGHPDQRLIFVSHGGVITAFMAKLLQESGAADVHVFPGNTSVTRVRFENGTFTVMSLPDNSHLIQDGVQYSGENFRVRIYGLSVLALHVKEAVSADLLEQAVANATAVESAWVDDHMVGFIRTLTDGVWQGYMDMEMAVPGYEFVIPVLRQRLQARFPSVRFTRLTAPIGTAPFLTGIRDRDHGA